MSSPSSTPSLPESAPAASAASARLVHALFKKFAVVLVDQLTQAGCLTQSATDEQVGEALSQIQHLSPARSNTRIYHSAKAWLQAVAEDTALLTGRPIEQVLLETERAFQRLQLSRRKEKRSTPRSHSAKTLGGQEAARPEKLPNKARPSSQRGNSAGAKQTRKARA